MFCCCYVFNFTFICLNILPSTVPQFVYFLVCLCNCAIFNFQLIIAMPLLPSPSPSIPFFYLNRLVRAHHHSLSLQTLLISGKLFSSANRAYPLLTRHSAQPLPHPHSCVKSILALFSLNCFFLLTITTPSWTMFSHTSNPYLCLCCSRPFPRFTKTYKEKPNFLLSLEHSLSKLFTNSKTLLNRQDNPVKYQTSLT